MLQDSPMTAAEEAADIAFEQHAAAVAEMRRVWDDPASNLDQRRVSMEQSIRAGKRFERLFLALDEPPPTQPDLLAERASLSGEGFLLIALLCAYIGLMLPSDFYLFVTVLAGAALMAWAANFIARYINHRKRRGQSREIK